MYTIMVVGNESTANANQPVTKAEGSEGQATAEEIFKGGKHTLLMLFFHPVIWKMDSVC